MMRTRWFVIAINRYIRADSIVVMILNTAYIGLKLSKHTHG
jgi:hypothetical protein